MTVQKVIVGCVTSSESKKYKKVGTITTRQIKYGPTKTISQRNNKLFAKKNQKIQYQNTKTVKTISAPTCSFKCTPITEEQSVRILCNSTPSPCTTCSCTQTSCK